MQRANGQEGIILSSGEVVPCASNLPPSTGGTGGATLYLEPDVDVPVHFLVEYESERVRESREKELR